MVRIRSALICAVATLPLAGCYGLYGNDEFANYVGRKDTITMSAGDAKEVNARTHMNQAWPQGVTDRVIYGNGARGVHAVECYEYRGAGAARSPSSTTSSATQGSGGSSQTQSTTTSDRGKPEGC